MDIKQVSIALKPNAYTTFRDLPNSLSNTIGEYVDNAVQSYFDNKERLKSYEPNYKLCIKRIMGHSSPDITDSVYTHKAIEQLIEAIDLI